LIPTLSGYASATTTFRTPGWNVKDLDQGRREPTPVLHEEVREAEAHVPLGPLRRRYGDVDDHRVPAEHVTTAPCRCAGRAPARAGTSMARSNLRLLYEYTCEGVPDARFACRICSDGASRCLEDGDCPGAAPAARSSPTVHPRTA
jgi:hypothetical protein